MNLAIYARSKRSLQPGKPANFVHFSLENEALEVQTVWLPLTAVRQTGIPLKGENLRQKSYFKLNSKSCGLGSALFTLSERSRHCGLIPSNDAPSVPTLSQCPDAKQQSPGLGQAMAQSGTFKVSRSKGQVDMITPAVLPHKGASWRSARSAAQPLVRPRCSTRDYRHLPAAQYRLRQDRSRSELR